MTTKEINEGRAYIQLRKRGTGIAFIAFLAGKTEQEVERAIRLAEEDEELNGRPGAKRKRSL